MKEKEIMSIQKTIQDQLKDAMRARDSVKLETLRYILSELKYAQIAKQAELSDDECIEVLGREVKKRKDAIDLFHKSGREELVDEEKAKLVFITSLLPAQLESSAIETVVDEVITKLGKENMGMVMKEVMARVKGRADGRMVSEIVQAKMKA